MDALGVTLAVGCGSAAGLVTGRFMPALIAWAPAGNLSWPAARCTRCPVPPRPAGLLATAAWLWRRGRCRACGAGAWHRVLQLVTGALFAVMALRFWFSPVLPAAWYLAATGVALSVIDIRQHRLPDRLTLPSYPAALLLLGGAGLLLPGGLGRLAGAFAGMAVAGGFFLLLAFLQPTGIGWGDVKLSGVLGFYLGWFGTAALAAGLLGAFALAAVTGVALIVAGRATRKSHLPLGAFMLAAALAVIAAGGPVPALR